MNGWLAMLHSSGLIDVQAHDEDFGCALCTSRPEPRRKKCFDGSRHRDFFISRLASSQDRDSLSHLHSLHFTSYFFRISHPRSASRPMAIAVWHNRDSLCGGGVSAWGFGVSVFWCLWNINTCSQTATIAIAAKLRVGELKNKYRRRQQQMGDGRWEGSSNKNKLYDIGRRS